MTYDDIEMFPVQASSIKSRKDVSTESKLGPFYIPLPIITSPMKDVCDGNIAKLINQYGGFGIIHRFQSIEGQVFDVVCYVDRWAVGIENGIEYGPYKVVGAAIGVMDDYFERFQALYSLGVRLFCIDTANGANELVKTAYEKIKAEHSNICVIAGNVASFECYKWLAELGVDIVRIGIGNGSHCATKMATGIYRHPAAVLKDIAYGKKADLTFRGVWPKIIADGGISEPGHMCKALWLGADYVMLGKLIAQCHESPAETKQGNKLYRGSASFSVQYESGKTPEFVEGIEKFIVPGESLKDLMSKFDAGLRSCLSYFGKSTLTDFKGGYFE